MQKTCMIQQHSQEVTRNTQLQQLGATEQRMTAVTEKAPQRNLHNPHKDTAQT